MEDQGPRKELFTLEEYESILASLPRHEEPELTWSSLLAEVDRWLEEQKAEKAKRAEPLKKIKKEIKKLRREAFERKRLEKLQKKKN